MSTTAPLSPLARLEKLGGSRTLYGALMLALLQHTLGGAAAANSVALSDISAWSTQLDGSLDALMPKSIEIAVEKDPEPPPPEPEPEKKEVVDLKEKAPKEEAAPVAAQAAQVITAETDPNAPVDFGDPGFVQGTGTSYAGGTTQANGTGTKPNLAGVIGTGGSGAAQVGNLSRKPGLDGSTDWDDCPFPSEAEAAQVDKAYVTMRVEVSAEGRAKKVIIVKDPGLGFAREARACAMRKRYTPAKDQAGNTVDATTEVIGISFEHKD